MNRSPHSAADSAPAFSDSPTVPVCGGPIATKILICVFAIGIQTSNLFAQATSPFDRERLAELLKSNEIESLRQATRIIKTHPDLSQEFLPAIAKRASHPELTPVLGWLLNHSSDPDIGAKLIRQAQSYHPMTRELIETAVRDRVAPAVAKPAQPIRVTRSSTSTRPKPRPNGASQPVFEFNRTQPNSPATKKNTRVFTQKQKAIRSEAPLGSSKTQLTRLEKLNHIPAGEPLSDSDWGFLFQVMNQRIQIDRSPAAATGTSEFYPVFRLARTVIAKHYPSDKQKTWDYLLDPDTTNPDRLLSALETISREDQETFDFVWQIADTEDVTRRRSALNRLYFDRSFAEDYVDQLIQRMSVDPDRVRDFVIPVFRISQAVSDQSRSKILAWQLSHFERAFALASDDEPIHKKQIEIVNQAKSVIRPMSRSAQFYWVTQIVAQADASDQPRAYVGLIDSMKCSIDPAADLLERLLNATVVTRDRLYLARLLYRAKGHESGVYPMFRDVISDPSPDRDEFFAALMGVIEVGERAAELAPDLVRVLKDPLRSTNHATTLSAITSIGPSAAESAGPTLIAMLSDPDHSRVRRLVTDALKAVKPQAESTLPTLTKIALNTDANVKYDMATQAAALTVIGAYGPEASSLVGRLTPLTQSTDRLISMRAKIVIDQIRRSQR